MVELRAVHWYFRSPGSVWSTWLWKMCGHVHWIDDWSASACSLSANEWYFWVTSAENPDLSNIIDSHHITYILNPLKFHPFWDGNNFLMRFHLNLNKCCFWQWENFNDCLMTWKQPPLAGASLWWVFLAGVSKKLANIERTLLRPDTFGDSAKLFLQLTLDQPGLNSSWGVSEGEATEMETTHLSVAHRLSTSDIRLRTMPFFYNYFPTPHHNVQKKSPTRKVPRLKQSINVTTYNASI